MPASVDSLATLDVRLAETDRLIAEARLRGQRADGRLDPSVGFGVRPLRDTGDRALIANVSVPLPIFDRNRGNISAAKSDVAAANPRRENQAVNAEAEIANAQAEPEAAAARPAAPPARGQRADRE